MTSHPHNTDLSPERLHYFDQQNNLFAQNKAQLLHQYLGEFVAFENGIVLDHDPDEQTLLSRVYQTYSYRDLLIKQVLAHEPHRSVGGAIAPQRGY
ncbi:MAG: hypothetical protein AB4042_06915 [Leptolyngbyaceae cyanobacterium]